MSDTQSIIVYRSKTEQQQDEWMQKHPEVMYTIGCAFLFFFGIIFISVICGFIGMFFTTKKNTKLHSNYHSGFNSRLQFVKPKPWYRKFF